eukprot:jgi/Botrbrau1/5242/Bobra.0172s0104.1
MGKRKAEVLDQDLSWEPIQPGIDGGPLSVYFSTMMASNLHRGAKWKLLSKADRRRPPLLVTRVGDVEFRGSAMTGHPNRAPFCKYALAVRDKRTGEVTYSQLKGGRVWRLEPYEEQPQEEVTDRKAELPEERYLDYKRLVNTFGSQKQKRQLAAREAAMVKSDNVASMKEVERLMKSIQSQAQASHATKEDVLKEAHAYRNVPPHHAEATRPEDAYRLEDLVPAEVRAELSTGRLYRASVDAQYRKEVLQEKKQASPYVLAALGRKCLEKVDPEMRLEALAYLDVLLILNRLPHDITMEMQLGSTSRLASRLHVSDGCLPSLLSLFYSRGPDKEEGATYSRSATQKQLLTAYILVLALIADGFGLGAREFEALRVELGTPSDQLILLFRELGCTVIPTSPVGSKIRQYQVLLALPNAKGDVQTLGDAFPKPKVSRARRPR